MTTTETDSRRLKLGTRGSRLALTQSGQVGQGQAVTGAQGVARVLARRHADDLQPLDRLRGQVLEGVDHQVHLAIQECVAQPGREDPHPAELP